MNRNSLFVLFLYKTIPGRLLLRLIQRFHADRIIVRFLRSPWSRFLVFLYIKYHRIPISKEERLQYRTFRDFFVRERKEKEMDPVPGHLISPCDGWLSVYPVKDGSSFEIKGSRYRVQDLVQDKSIAQKYNGGTCMVFRLCAADYHHYCYIDDGYQGKNHFIPGTLHSVQPAACETYPVFTLNRRSWCLMATERFGPVVQTEIGALIVGGIVNIRENTRVCRGMEKGHFELAGSTIVLLFESGRIRLLPELELKMKENSEVRVRQGMWIASREEHG